MNTAIKRGLAPLEIARARSVRPSLMGFTLVELLVVISVVSLLSSVVMAATNGARVKARDTQRIQALGEIRKALALYYHDNGYYPPSGSITGNASGNVISYNTNSQWTNFANVLSQYIPSLPKDPVNTATSYYNIYAGSGTAYYGYGYRSMPTTGTPTEYDLIARFETTSLLNCTNKQWISHAGNWLNGGSAGTVWCQGALNATGNLYNDH